MHISPLSMQRTGGTHLPTYWKRMIFLDPSLVPGLHGDNANLDLGGMKEWKSHPCSHLDLEGNIYEFPDVQ